MYRRPAVVANALATVGYAERSRVGQHTNRALVACWRHLEHRQPQHQARGIEHGVRLVAELAVLETHMAELAGINNAEMERPGCRVQLVAVQLAEGP